MFVDKDFNMQLKEKLAIDGGEKIRANPFPAREQFDRDVFDQVKNVFNEAWKSGVDFGYQGKWEERYTGQFCQLMGGGYADAVSSGSVGVFIALAALQLNAEDEVLVSPVNDPGTISAVMMNQLKPVVVDSEANSFNMCPQDLERKITDKSKAILVAHIGGNAASIEHICAIAKKHQLRVIEDCSQSHGADINGRKLGTFGDISVFSTMFSKGHATGGCGAVVYTQNQELYALIRSYADRGKPFFDADYDPKNPEQNLFPALNFNIDELSCAIGIATLTKLTDSNNARLRYLETIKAELVKQSECCRGAAYNTKAAPFFYTIEVDVDKLTVSKKEFAEAVKAEGIPVNADYRYIVSEWPWVFGQKACPQETPNAVHYRDSSFNLLFHEKCADQEIEDTLKSILKVEKAYLKP